MSDKSTTRPSAKKPVIAKAAIREEDGRSARNRFVVRGSVVESPGGLSPPGAPRSVREPLDSYGSRCSAVSMAELPVGKERWLGSAEPVKPGSAPLGFS